MGRRCFGIPPDLPYQVSLRRVPLNSGGYDEGGAYWGTGHALWWAYCFTDQFEYQQFVRAASRTSAACKLGLNNFHLKVPEPDLELDEHEMEVTALLTNVGRTLTAAACYGNTHLYRAGYRAKLWTLAMTKEKVVEYARKQGYTHIKWKGPTALDPSVTARILEKSS
jgi:hypothetical protein